MKNKIKVSLIFFICFIYISLICITPVKAVDLNCFKDKLVDSKSQEKVIYLTFDDGPSTVVGGKILDILKEENVKATFFVVGYKIKDREDILKRMHNEGHSIGLHTYTHKYNKIYASENSFLEEMDRTAKEIERVIGISPKILRFPSGSKKHLTKSLLEKLHMRNYKIYDWNLCLSDGINYRTSASKLYKDATGKCITPNNIILLAHSDQPNKTTCEALPKIIKYYKNLGYTFKTITDETPEYYFKISK